MLMIEKDGKCYFGSEEFLKLQGFSEQEIKDAQWQEQSSLSQASAQ